MLADWLGLKKVFVLGVAIFACVYFLLWQPSRPSCIANAFTLYGVFAAAATDGVAKPWISNSVAEENTATPIGTYLGFHSVCTLESGSLTGLLWLSFASKIALIVISDGCLLIIVYIALRENPGVNSM